MIQSTRMKKYTSTAIYFIALFCFYIITISAFRNMARESFLASLLFLPVLVAFIILQKKKYKISDKKILVFQVVAHVASFILTIIISIWGSCNFGWDWKGVMTDATNIVTNGYNHSQDYYLRYPNNQLWLVILTTFFYFCKSALGIVSADGLRIAATILSIIFVRVACIFMFLSFKKIFSPKKARIFDIGVMMFLPISMYAQFAYTDTIGIVLVSMMIFFFLNIKDGSQQQKRNTKYYLQIVIIALLTALLYKLKIMALIVPIAIFIYEVLTSSKIFQVVKKYSLIVVLSIIFIVALSSQSILSIGMVDKIDSKRYEFPVTHWIMMSLNPNSIGGFVTEDSLYTQGIEGYTAKKRATIDKIKERINQMGPLGTLKHIFDTKMRRHWGSSLLSADAYISVLPIYPNSFTQQLFGSQQTGSDNGSENVVEAKYHYICLAYSWIVYMLLIIGCFMSVILSYKNKKLHFSQIAIVGIFVFFLLWEVNPRYLFVFLPVIFISSAIGWEKINMFMSNKGAKIHKILAS